MNLNLNTENYSTQNNDINNIQINFPNQSTIPYPLKSPHPPDLWEDDYILELHKKLEEKREQRKISEQNVKILNGRVRCLKDENKKICAKIDITKKKTKEFSGLSKDGYEKYFKKHKEANAYALSNPRVFKKPKSLTDYGIESAPQSFYYI